MTLKKLTLTVDAGVIDTAREYDINLSKAATNGIEAAIEREKKIKELGL